MFVDQLNRTQKYQDCNW